MRTKEKKSLALIIAIVLILILAFFMSNFLLIYHENIYTDGKVQEYFDRCNSCSANIVIDNQKAYVSDLKFSIGTSFSNTANYNGGCVSVDSWDSAYDQQKCKDAGYVCYWRYCGGKYMPSCDNQCYDDAKCSHNGLVGSAQCWGEPTPITSDWISCTLDGQEVFRKYANGTQTAGINGNTINLAPIINKYIQLGSTDYENKIAVSCSAEKNSGSAVWSASPSVEIDYIDPCNYSVYAEQNSAICNPPIACTMEAKVCLDGSSVGRNASLNCEFNACPLINLPILCYHDSDCQTCQNCINGSCEQLLGCGTDIHGCASNGGYSWCESKQKCLRVGEENCLPVQNQTCTENYSVCIDGKQQHILPDCSITLENCIMPIPSTQTIWQQITSALSNFFIYLKSILHI